MKFKNYPCPLIFLSIFSINAYCDSSYYCTQYPNSPQCSSSLILTTDPSNTSSNSQTMFNTSYINQVIGAGSSMYATTSSSGKQTQIESDSDVTIVDSDKGNKDKNTQPKGSVTASNIFSNEVDIKAIPISFNINEMITLNSMVTYVNNKITKQQGIGDSAIGIGFNFNNIGDLGKVNTGVTLAIPTGDEDKKLSSEVHSLTINGGYTKRFMEAESKISIEGSYTRQITMPQQF